MGVLMWMVERIKLLTGRARLLPHVANASVKLPSNPPSPPLPLMPEDEADRVNALHQYDILDTLPEQEFDDLTAIAPTFVAARSR